MKRFLITSLVTLMGIAGAHAVPAYPHRIAVEIDGELVFIRMLGDEHCHWAETDDGYSVCQDSTNHWCYAVHASDGSLVASNHRMKVWPDAESKALLSTIPRHLRPTPTFLSSVRHAQEYHANRAKKAVVGERKVLVILMEYKDKAFSKTSADFHRLFNEEGYYADGARGSVHDYYNAASYGQLNLTCDVYGPYQAAHDMAFYGRNKGDSKSENAYELFREAVNMVADETSLSQYDGDGDGYIDNVHIIYAGYGEESGAAADAIWSHELSFRPYITILGLKIDRYSCSPELRMNENYGAGISRIGVHCHEIGHALGAMDYYDTDYEDGGEYEGTGMWDVMASGSHNSDGIIPADFNPYVKAIDFGWINLKHLPGGEVNIQPSNESADHYYYIKKKTDGDYYILENRQRIGWGRGLPGAGLLIYHIHTDISRAGNTINATSPQQCYIVCASSRYDLPDNTPESYGGSSRINSTGCPFPGFSYNNSFNNTSTPAAFWWTEDSCSINITDIEQNGDLSISLNNQSIGLLEEPDEKGTITLFHEGFEQETTGLSENQYWQRQKSGYAGITAYDGDYYLILSAKNEVVQSKEDAIEYAFNKNIADGRIFISGYVFSDGLRGRSNEVRIGYKTSESDEWQYDTLTLATDGEWTYFEVEFPENALPLFRIEGRAVPLSLIALDELSVQQNVTVIDYIEENNYIHQAKNPGTFTLSGIRITPETDTPTRRSGYPASIYITNGKKLLKRQ